MEFSMDCMKDRDSIVPSLAGVLEEPARHRAIPVIPAIPVIEHSVIGAPFDIGTM